MSLDDRSRFVLKAIVSSYIKTAIPVGSQTITRSFDMGVSPATIRNIMADLEAQGFLTQPHTSAGRIPTEKGYRFYVDTLFQGPDFSKEREELFGQAEQLVQRETIQALLQDTSKLLSDVSQYMAIVTAPKFSSTRIKQVEFVRLRKRSVMAVCISQDGFIQNKFFELSEDLSQKELNKVADILNNLYSGLTLQEIRRKLLKQMQKMKDLYDHLLQETFELTRRTFMDGGTGGGDAELYMDGASHMIDLPDFSDFRVMKGLLGAFEEKKVIIQLLDKYIGTEGVQVYIGSENPILGNHRCSLVVSHYKRGDQILGTLGILGPTRMEYSKIIPLVDSTAKKISRLLESSQEEESSLGKSKEV
ncbi:MAG: heat-inducible transcription repressor HrcA [Nitrospirae bacterium]|nr:heat-inducible transcription repressor HrcA [Candidatus Manganitrophaceae bacterium]